jgi:hypothetical protein
MATNVTWNGVTYSIPAANELNWSTLSSFILALGNGAAVTEEMKQAMRTATTSPVTIAAASDFAVATDLSVAGAVAVNLPAGANGQIFAIVDGKGDAATNNITITPNGAETINGAATYVINENRGAVILAYSTVGTKWVVVSRYTPGAVLVNPMDSAGDMVYGGASGVATKLDSGTAGQVLLSNGAAAPTWTDTITTAKTLSDANLTLTQTTANRQLAVTQSGASTTTANAVVKAQLTNTGGSLAPAGYFSSASDSGNGALVIDSLTSRTGTNPVLLVRGNGTGGKLLKVQNNLDTTPATVVAIDGDGTIACSPAGASILAYTPTDSRIIPDTGDGNDTKAVALCGGGTISNTRGGFIRVYGNEHASRPGAIDLVVGGTAGSSGLEISGPTGTALAVDTTNAVRIKGTSGTGNAPAGYIGEHVKSTVLVASSVTLTNNTYADITSITLTAGDWDVTGVVAFQAAAITGTQVQGGIGTLSGNATNSVRGSTQFDTATVPTSVTDICHSISPFRAELSGSTTYYLKAYGLFSAGTLKAFGRITARRVR